jgi:sulfhydrogenase subunit beta (sulfur reductase)
MTPKFIPTGDLRPILAKVLSGYQVFSPKRVGDEWRWGEAKPAEIELSQCRTVEPLKGFFFRARDDLGSCFGDDKGPSAPQRAIVGVAACDLAALEVLDWVFLEGKVADPYYEAFRKNTVLIAADCAQPKDVCFCTFLGRTPFPLGGADLMLSPGEGGFVIEVGSERGGTLMEEEWKKLADATAPQLQARERARAAVRQRVDENGAKAGLRMVSDLQERVRTSRALPIWEHLAQKCVECAACNFICPTCHCFLLVDMEEGQNFRRFKNWDGCLYRAFALEASGANPRPRRAHRLHGRVEKKFDFMRTNAGQWGCVGCGRCIQACAGGIDMRQILSKLVAPREGCNA